MRNWVESLPNVSRGVKVEQRTTQYGQRIAQVKVLYELRWRGGPTADHVALQTVERSLEFILGAIGRYWRVLSREVVSYDLILISSPSLS